MPFALRGFFLADFPGRSLARAAARRSPGRGGQDVADVLRRSDGIKNAPRGAAKGKMKWAYLIWGQDWGQVLKNSLKQAKNRKNLAISLLFRGGAAGTCT